MQVRGLSDTIHVLCRWEVKVSGYVQHVNRHDYILSKREKYEICRRTVIL